MDKRRLKALWWWEAALSAWSPLGVFAVALVPYLFLVVEHPSSARWAQPTLKGFGLLMVLWFLGVWVMRLGIPEVGRLRRARLAARELVDELRRIRRRNGGQLSPQAQLKLDAQVEVLNGVRVTGPSEKIREEAAKLSELMDKNLSSLRGQTWMDAALGVVLWLGVALFVRTVFIEPYRIPSGSMIQTLAIGDQIFINKFVYGVRIPFTNWVPFVLLHRPERGDVIVFNNPVTLQDFVKRLVGLPGDVIEVKRDQIFVNGVAQPRTLINPSQVVWDGPPSMEWIPVEVCSFWETLGGHGHVALQRHVPLPGPEAATPLPCDEPSREYQGKYVVPEGQVFVMGDNRDNSSDSRFGLGLGGDTPAYVPFGNIKGKAMIVWLSWSHGGLLSNLFGGSGLRTDRLFLPIQ
jgi:signal peptidase I